MSNDASVWLLGVTNTLVLSPVLLKGDRHGTVYASATCVSVGADRIVKLRQSTHLKGMHMRTYSTNLFLVILLAISAVAQARDYTFAPDPADLGELAHGENYAWRILWSPPANEKIVGATLTVKNIDNWILEPNANWLRIYLLDTPPTNGKKIGKTVVNRH